MLGRLRITTSLELATYIKKSNKNWLHECENNKVDKCINKVSKAGPVEGTALKNNSEGEYKREHNSLKPQKQTTVSPGLHQGSNKNGKYRNVKRRRKAKTVRNRTYNKRACLFALTQDKKAQAKEGGYRRLANDTEKAETTLSHLHTYKRQSNSVSTPSHKSSHPPHYSKQQILQLNPRSYLKPDPDPSGHLDPCKTRISHHLGNFNTKPSDAKNMNKMSLEKYHKFTKEQMLTSTTSHLPTFT